VHGEDKVEREVSNSYLSNEIQSVYGGMMVALPPTKWKKFQKMTTAQLADQLLQWGGDTDLSRYPKHPRARSGETKRKAFQRPSQTCC
jgi:hypothetical protein